MLIKTRYVLPSSVQYYYIVCQYPVIYHLVTIIHDKATNNSSYKFCMEKTI